MHSIGPDMEVTLHFALKLENQEVIDNNFDHSPATFVVGDGQLLDGFEKVLYGLMPGDYREFRLPPEDSFGSHNPDNVQKFPRHSFEEDQPLEMGLVILFSDAAQDEVPGVIVAIADDYVTVDFNHPLAGRTILFEVRILDVAPMVTH